MSRVRPGDLVVPVGAPSLPGTPRCLACRSGHQDYCYTGDSRERGIKEAHGFMTEYVVDARAVSEPVPPDLREIAVLAEPLTIAEKALAQLSWMMQQRPPWTRSASTRRRASGRGLSAPGARLGPVGLARAMTLVSAGSRPTSTRARCPRQPAINLVAVIGASYVSSRGPPPFARPGRTDRQHRPRLRGRRAFVLRPRRRCRSLGTNGIFVLTGVPGLHAFIEAKPARLMRDMVLKNQVLLGTSTPAGRVRIRAARSRRLPRSWPRPWPTLIADRYPPEQAAG